MFSSLTAQVLAYETMSLWGNSLKIFNIWFPDVVCLFGMVLIEEAFAVCIEAASHIWGAFTAKTEEILTDPHIEKLQLG